MSPPEVTISSVITLTDNAARNVADLLANDGPPAGPALGRRGRREFRVLSHDVCRYPGRSVDHMAMFGILKVIVDSTHGEHIADARLNSNDGLPGVGVHIDNASPGRSCGCARCLGGRPHR